MKYDEIKIVFFKGCQLGFTPYTNFKIILDAIKGVMVSTKLGHFGKL
jgi:hypothetical protein